ncbi:MAG: YncE family protein [Acidobacteria bacterium]|nr:YncE family protein [Acidobacteriota bacterium]
MNQRLQGLGREIARAGAAHLFACALFASALAQETHRLAATISLDSVPVACSVSSDNRKLLITTGDEQVLFYDLRRGRVLSRLRTDGSPLLIHRLPGDKTALVGHWNGRKISLLDLYGNRFMRNIAVGDGPTFFAQNNRLVLLLLARAQKLSFLNPYTLRPSKDVAFDGPPAGLAVAPGRDRAYVAVATQKMAVVDLASRRALHSFPVQTAKDTALAVDPEERWLFALGPRNTVMRISLDAEKESKRISTGAGSVDLKISPDGKYLYVSNGLDGKVSILAAESLTDLEQISVGARPSFLDVSRDNRYVFVCNRGDRTISVLERVPEKAGESGVGP